MGHGVAPTSGDYIRISRFQVLRSQFLYQAFLRPSGTSGSTPRFSTGSATAYCAARSLHPWLQTAAPPGPDWVVLPASDEHVPLNAQAGQVRLYIQQPAGAVLVVAGGGFQ